ncbi:LamG-like jellyroll fold domain-containing protein [Streptomyces sp. NPDC052101]|uniref:LamG-like jellyroll fold domain-containing protein n=1 Tax=Streptomyces sp. NPDC052101 TaxID=3155763 RepID=UPI003422D79B
MPSADSSARRQAPAATALALGAGLPAAPAVAAQAADTPRPAAHYTFDQDDLASGRITDSSGNGLTATLVNPSTAQSVTGAVGGRALGLPGGSPASDGAYVRLPREVLGDASDLTVSARVKWSGDKASWQRIFDLGTDTTKYLFMTPYNGSVLRTAVTTGGGGAEAQVSGYAPLPGDGWWTVTVTLDTAAHRVTTYLDGVAVSSAATTVKAKDLLDSAATAAGCIGKSFYQDPLFKGAIDEFTVWHSALTPEQVAGTVAPVRWQGSYEAEDAAHTGSGYSKNGPEGSPCDVSKFYTSGGYDVGGLRTGSDVTLDFTVDVPEDGTYDLSVFANSLNTFDKVKEQGPTNVFLRVDGTADSEQQLYLPLGYKWVVWDHTDTKVRLTKGKHTLTLAAKSLDGERATKGDAIVDRVTLSLPEASAAAQVHEGELAWTGGGAGPVYDLPKHTGTPTTGSGAVRLAKNQTATFWVYSPADREATLGVDTLGSADARLSVNGHDVLHLTKGRRSVAVSLSGGINKVTVTGGSVATLVDRLTVKLTDGALKARTYEAQDAKLAGSATLTPLSLATDGTAITGIGGEPGNGNTATFAVAADKAGLYALRIRYSNPEQSQATHYNPDPLARHADIVVNGGAMERVGFPHTFHQNNFWELTIPVHLTEGQNTITFRCEELPNFDGTSYASDTFPGVLLRSRYAPLIDRITVAPYAREVR